jgi:hypothetical protein
MSFATTGALLETYLILILTTPFFLLRNVVAISVVTRFSGLLITAEPAWYSSECCVRQLDCVHYVFAEEISLYMMRSTTFIRELKMQQNSKVSEA